MSSHYSGYKRILTIALVAVLSFGILGYAARTTQAAPLAQTVRTVHVNQIGYLPNLNKIASAVNSSTTPVAWQLKNSGGTVVASGNTTVYGNDAASRDNVHIIDFSSFTTAGTGYTLTVGTAVSNPFDISTSVYGVMKYDALAYFYHNRSGIEIKADYAGDAK